MMMNAQTKPKSSRSKSNQTYDLRTFLAGAVEGVLVSRRFISSKEASQTGDESTLESARSLSSRFQSSITPRALDGADKILAFMGEKKSTMATAKSEFTRSLAHEFSLARLNGVRGDKAGLVIWAVKFYMDAQKEAKQAPVEAPVAQTRAVECQATRITNLFAKATAAGLQHPKIRLQAEGLGKVVFALAGSRSRYAGEVLVTDGRPFGQNTYYGRITKDGQLVPSRDCADTVRDLIAKLANDPVGVAKAHGHLHGNCCFCGRDLETKESVAVGYGPICADKFSLPWGEEKASAVVTEDEVTA